MLDKIALTLLIIGGLNWGSIGIFQFDLVAFIGGGQNDLVHFAPVPRHRRHRREGQKPR